MRLAALPGECVAGINQNNKKSLSGVGRALFYGPDLWKPLAGPFARLGERACPAGGYFSMMKSSKRFLGRVCGRLAASRTDYSFAKGSAPPTGEIKLLPFAGNPSVSLAADSLSLRLGHGAALICHRHIIHYRAATSLPLTQGSLWCRAMPLRYPLRGGGCGAVCGAGDERAQSKKIPRPLLDGGKMFFVTWRCSGCRGGYP